MDARGVQLHAPGADLPALRRVSHEHPGVTVLDVGAFDIGIDVGREWPTTPSQRGKRRPLEAGWQDLVPGLRVFVYDGRWAYDDQDPEVWGILWIPDASDLSFCGPQEASIAHLSPLIWSIESRDRWIHVVFRNGGALVVAHHHVFTYWCDDGARNGIVHAGPVDRVECAELNCDPDLVGRND